MAHSMAFDPADFASAFIAQLTAENELLKSLLSSASQELKAYQVKYPFAFNKSQNQNQSQEKPFSMQPLFESYETSRSRAHVIHQ
jgi:hypothetical protein